MILACLLVLPLVFGHGNMFHPPTWWDRLPSPGQFSSKLGCGTLGLSEDNEFTQTTGMNPDCYQFWYSNGVKIPGSATIPEDLAQAEVTCVHQAGHHDTAHQYPWHAPGTAPVFGPCGTMGGWPRGCSGDGDGTFGDCCSGNCDGFALGNNTEEYDWESIGGGIPVTEWFAGSHQEVRWHVGANHAGGYSYRMCRMPEGGISQVTEECFQQTPLNFVGEEQWVVYRGDHATGHRTELPAKRTREGTFPPGSHWTANPFWPKTEEGGDANFGSGEAIDYVLVPATLEPGEYVLSFRWDCKCSPQVWGSCATVLII